MNIPPRTWQVEDAGQTGFNRLRDLVAAEAWGQQQLPELLHIFESQLDSKAGRKSGLADRFCYFACENCFEHPTHP